MNKISKELALKYAKEYQELVEDCYE